MNLSGKLGVPNSSSISPQYSAGSVPFHLLGDCTQTAFVKYRACCGSAFFLLVETCPFGLEEFEFCIHAEQAF